MSRHGAETSPRLAAVERLRRDFDDAFTEPWDGIRKPQTRYLGVRCGQQRLAIDLSQLLTFHPRGDVVPLPTSLSQLLGLSSVDGKLYPCYSLAELLNWESRPVQWLLLCREAPVALAVEEVVGLFLVDAEAATDPDDSAAGDTHGGNSESDGATGSSEAVYRRKRSMEGRGGSPITGRIQLEGQELSVLNISTVLEDLSELIGEERI